ncbi:MAG: serine/threonine protein kinase [Planctomycetaceae bacterium]|nr:serine/threonine protein kinase [Planctomycetaceae bacterium]
MSQPDHPSDRDLTAFALGQLPGERAEHVEQHVTDCQQCCDTMLSLSSADTFADLLADLKDRTQLTDEEGRAVARSADPSSVPESLQHHPRYNVEQLVGTGGMGRVFRARHRMMDRTVALKVINEEWSSRPEVIHRFQREVKTAASLSHPHIVTAFDAEQADQTHFLVMEYVEGVDLAEVVKRDGPLSVHAACDYIRQAATGFEHAAQQGMVHRDIKPHNLMVTAEGVVKILDFGLAGLAPESVPDSTVTGSRSDLTSAGTVMGTPDFISPEQAHDARTADVRSDVYSLGATFYFLLTGRPPFDGTVMQKLRSHREDRPVPVADIRPEIPGSVEDVIQRMMARDPSDRFQSHGEVIAALQAIQEPTHSPQPTMLSRRSPLLRIGALLVAVAATVLAMVTLLTESVADKLARIRGPQTKIVQRGDGVNVTLYGVPAEVLGGQSAAVCDFGSCRIAVLNPKRGMDGMATGLSVPVDGKLSDKGQVVSQDGRRDFYYEYTDGRTECRFLGVPFAVEDGLLELRGDRYRFDSRAVPGRLLVMDASSQSVTVQDLAPVKARVPMNRPWHSGKVELLANGPKAGELTSQVRPSLRVGYQSSTSRGADRMEHDWSVSGLKVGHLVVQLKKIANGKIRVAEERVFSGYEGDPLDAEIRLATNAALTGDNGRQFQATLDVAVRGLNDGGSVSTGNLFPFDVEGMQSMESATQGRVDVSSGTETILYYRGFWDPGHTRFAGRIESMVDASKRGARFAVVTLLWKDEHGTTDADAAAAEQQQTVIAATGGPGSAEEGVAGRSVVPRHYELDQVKILAVYEAKDGSVEIMFSVTPESLWYCPGVVTREADDGLELYFVRATIKEKPDVTHPAIKAGGERTTSLLQSVKIPGTGRKIFRRAGDNRYQLR